LRAIRRANAYSDGNTDRDSNGNANPYAYANPM
jgi:hypothetical protein